MILDKYLYPEAPSQAESPDSAFTTPEAKPHSSWLEPIANVANVIDTGGRFVRTSLENGLGAGWDAIWDPSKAVSPTDLRRKYLFNDVGTEGDGFFRGSANPMDWDYGDIVDFVGDTVVGAATDPLSYLTLGLTAEGTAAEQAALRSKELLRRGVVEQAGQDAGRQAMYEALNGGLDRAAAQEVGAAAEQAGRTQAYQNIAKDFETATGKAFPKTAPAADWMGTEATLSGRLKAGEAGMQFGIPFTSLHTTPTAINTGAGRALATVLNPLEVAGSALANTSAGRKLGDWTRQAALYFKNPSIRDAFGLSTRDAETQARREVEYMLKQHIEPAEKALADAAVPVEKLDLVTRLKQTFDPRSSEPLLGGRKIEEALSDQGILPAYDTGTRLENARQVQADLLSLNEPQRAAVWSAAEKLHQADIKAIDILKSHGIDAKILGEEMLNAPEGVAKSLAFRQKQLDSLNKRIEKLEAQAAKTPRETPPPSAEAPAAVSGGRQPTPEPSATHAINETVTPSETVVKQEAGYVYKPKAQDVEDLLNPNAENWSRIQEAGYVAKKDGVQNTDQARASLVAIAQKVSESKSAAEAWEYIKDLHMHDAKRVAKLLGVPGTELSVMSEGFPGKSKSIERILGGFKDGKDVFEKQARPYLRGRKTEFSSASKSLEQAVGGGEEPTTLKDLLASPEKTTNISAEDLAIASEESPQAAQALREQMGLGESAVSKEQEMAAREAVDTKQAAAPKTTKADYSTLEGLEPYQKEMARSTLDNLESARSVEEAAQILADVKGEELDAVGKAYGMAEGKGMRKRVANLVGNVNEAINDIEKASGQEEIDAIMGRLSSEEKRLVTKSMGETPPAAGEVSAMAGGEAEAQAANLNEFFKTATPMPRERLNVNDRVVSDIAQNLGIDVRFFEDMPAARGLFDRGAGTIGLRAGMNPDELAHVFGHEFTHKAFGRLSDAGAQVMLDSARTVLGDEYDRLIEDITKRYAAAGKTLSPAQALEEILVDAGGKLFRDDGMKWIAEAAKVEPTIIDQIVAAFREIKTQIETWIAKAPEDAPETLQVMARRLQEMEVRALKLKQAARSGPEEVSAMLGELQGAKTAATTEGEAAAKSAVAAEPGDSLTELYAKREQLQQQVADLNTEYLQKKRLAAAVPSFAPTKLEDDVAQDIVIGEGGRVTIQTKPVNQSGTSYTFSATRGDRPDLTGVPMTLREKQLEVLRSGGSRVTGYTTPEEAVGAVDLAKSFFTKDGLKAAKEEAAKYPFRENIIDAYKEYYQTGFYKSIRNQELNKNLGNTFNAIPTEAWAKMAEMARVLDKDGKPAFTLEDLTKEFQKLTPNPTTELKDILSPQMVLDLESGRKSLADAFNATSGPADYRKLENFLGNSKDVFVPADVQRRYVSYMMNSTQRLGATLTALTGPLADYLALWKKSQIIFPTSQIRNQIGDLFRMVQAGVMDRETISDFQKLWAPLASAGPEAIAKRNFSAWKNAVFELPSGKMTGEELLKLAADNGVIGTGRMAEVMQEAAAATAKKEMSTAGKILSALPASEQKYAALIQMREDINRLSAFASRLRAGDDALEASLRTEEALYNQARISPAADFLRKTGVAPFISWQAKNIPAQVEWAIRKPGEFAAMIRGLELLNGQGDEKIPEAALPQYLRNKYNVVLDAKRDPETGKLVYHYVTNNGVIPATDLQEIYDSHGRSLFDALGPLYKLGIDVYKGEYGEEGKRGLGAAIGSVVGKPADVVQKLYEGGANADLTARVDPRTGLRNFNVGEELLQQISPARVKQLDVEGQADKSEQKAKLDLNRAKGAARKAMQEYEQAKLVFQNDPGSLAEYEDAAQRAQVQYVRTQRQTQQTLGQIEKLRARIKRLQVVQ